MHSSHFLLAGLITLAANTVAAPTPAVLPATISTPAVSKRQAQSDEQPVEISDAEASRFADPAQWSQAAYCKPSVGDNVNGAQVLWTAGDGGSTIPNVYVAYHPQSNRIVLSHEGTDPFKYQSVEQDLKFAPVEANEKIARCLNDGALLHEGFQETWERSADGVLAAVRSALDTYPGASVLVTGHSLGAAISSLDSAWLRCNGIESETIVFGSPRIGNFGTVSALKNFSHLTNGRDPVPHLPPRDEEYYIGSPGEYWQPNADEGPVLKCAGLDNTNCAFSVDPVSYNVPDHLGVYAGLQTIGGTPDCWFF